VEAGKILERPIHERQIDNRPQVKILTGMTKDNPCPPPDSGSAISHCRVLGHPGWGGMGIVDKAQDLKLTPNTI
jgi:hypothetical protein